VTGGVRLQAIDRWPGAPRFGRDPAARLVRPCTRNGTGRAQAWTDQGGHASFANNFKTTDHSILEIIPGQTAGQGLIPCYGAEQRRIARAMAGEQFMELGGQLLQLGETHGRSRPDVRCEGACRRETANPIPCILPAGIARSSRQLFSLLFQSSCRNC
jgi:hypothetical protein